MSIIAHTISDLITFSSNQKPIDFKHAFDNLMNDKLTNAIANKKIEIARTIITPEESPEDTKDVETPQ